MSLIENLILCQDEKCFLRPEKFAYSSNFNHSWKHAYAQKDQFFFF